MVGVHVNVYGAAVDFPISAPFAVNSTFCMVPLSVAFAVKVTGALRPTLMLFSGAVKVTIGVGSFVIFSTKGSPRKSESREV